MNIETTHLDTPIGRVHIALDDERVAALGFAEQWPALSRRFASASTRPLTRRSEAVDAVRAYFEGDLAAIEGVAVNAPGTPFQERVWLELRAIPAGETRSYLELSRAIGRPSANRAVGAANGANAVSIVIPCHRVIRSDGALSGYAGGAPRKRWLLQHEARARSIPG